MKPQQSAVISTAVRSMAALCLGSVLFLASTGRSQAQIEQSTMQINGKMAIDAVGNAHLDVTMKFNPPRIYDRIKKAYPNLYVLFRDMISNDRANTEVDRSSTKINADDGAQTITFSSNFIGAAIDRDNKWQVTLSKGESLVSMEGTKVITSLVGTTDNGAVLNGTAVYSLPAGAHNIELDKDNHVLTYSLAAPPAVKTKGAGPTIDLGVRYPKNVMSALYKIYADNEVQNGRYWVAKAIIKNTGSGPMYDVVVNYDLGEFASPYHTQKYTMIMPHGAVVDCYYPLFKSTVSQLKTRTPMELNIKVTYKDGAGVGHTEERTERLSLMGINQFMFSNLSDEEMTDSWFDKNNNGPLLAAYVTKLDDPVKQLAGYISEAAGGVAAASNNPEDTVKWLRAAYNTELLNNIVYQTPSGLAAEDTFAQDIKYPRDVLRAKSGTCVDLAILYASLAESVGLKANLMLVPGHCFPVISVGGQIFPVESTGLGGGNQRMSFDQAVQVGFKEMQEHLQDGRFFLINVDQMQGEGHVTSPELPALESNFLDTVGIRRTGVITETRQAPNGGNNGRGAPTPDRTQNPNIPNQPEGPVVGSAKDFAGVWKGDVNGLQMTLLLNQTDNVVDGTLNTTGTYTVSGTFKNVTVTDDGNIKIHVRASGGGHNYSITLEGKRNGNTIDGTGTVITRGRLDIPLDTRSVSWSVHWVGNR